VNIFLAVCCVLAVTIAAGAAGAAAKTPKATLIPSGPAGLLDSPLDSRGFMRWGGGGPGSWVRIYANHGHVFAVIAGLRWDTSSDEGDGHGPGWSEAMRSGRGFRLRHPLGLLAAEPLLG